MDYTEYLLRDDGQTEAFRAKYADYIRAYIEECVLWVQSLPMFEWVNLTYYLDERDKESVIGLICLCYIDGRVNISFDRRAASIRREPDNTEELDKYLKEAGFKNWRRKRH